MKISRGKKAIVAVCSEVLMAGWVCNCMRPSLLNESFNNEAITLEDRTNKVQTNVRLIEEHIIDFSRLYVENMVPVSSDYCANVESKGLERVADNYARMHRDALEIALENLHAEEIPEERVEQFSEDMLKRIIEKSVKSRAFIDYQNETLQQGVKESMGCWVRERAGMFRRLLREKSNSENYFELVRNSFDEKEYKEHIRRLRRQGDNLYESIKKGKNLLGMTLSFIIDRRIEKIKDTSATAYNLTVDYSYRKNE